MTIGVWIMTTERGWNDSAVIIRDGTGDVEKRVRLEIKTPNELAYVREQLDAIEAAWRKQLADYMPKG